MIALLKTNTSTLNFHTRQVSYLNPIAAAHTILKGHAQQNPTSLCSEAVGSHLVGDCQPLSRNASIEQRVYLNATRPIDKRVFKCNASIFIDSGELLESDRGGLHHLEGARGAASRHPESHPGKSTFLSHVKSSYIRFAKVNSRTNSSTYSLLLLV